MGQHLKNMMLLCKKKTQKMIEKTKQSRVEIEKLKKKIDKKEDTTE